VEKADLSKGYQNPKRKLGVITLYLEIIEVKDVHPKNFYDTDFFHSLATVR